MTPRQEIRTVSVDLATPDLLRYLVKERFPGETVVTASLMAPSIVVLKMISEIDPATPIIFCHRPPVFQESVDYRTEIVAKLNLQNVSMNDGCETNVREGDTNHTVRMWVHYRDMPGRSSQLLHLNDCLAPYSCWINAVYHERRPTFIQNRVDVDGRLIKIDPLARWTKDDVREFMRTNTLPYHKMAKREYQFKGNKDGTAIPSYNF